MASPKPTLHLLTLPREIRDFVYSYLTHALSLRTIRYLGGTQTKVEVENAPCPSFMLVNSQIYEEYRENCMNNLTANIFDKWVHVRDDFWSTYRRCAVLDNEALSKVSLVTVRLEKYQLRDPDFRPHKVHMDNLLLAISEMTPLLHTLQVAEYHCLIGKSDVPFGDNDLPEQLPTSFPLMTLKQSVAGRRQIYLVPLGLGRTLEGTDTLFRAVTFSALDSKVDLWTEWLVWKEWKAYCDKPGFESFSGKNAEWEEERY